MSHHWLESLRKRIFGSRKTMRRPRVGPRLRLEPLEDRCVPATFMVQNLDDAGVGSLRQAILDANAAAGADDIVFQTGLTGTIALTSGEMSITESVTITGNGAASTVIDAQKMSRIFNLSQPGATAVDVSLTGLALNNATAGMGFSGQPGGAVFSTSSGTLTVIQSSFTGNSARAGGALSSLLGAIRVEESSFTSNTAAIQGGAIEMGSNSGASSVSNSTFTNNSGGIGGAVAAFGDSASISNSTFSGNSASVDGGAISVATGSLTTVIESTFDRNSTAGDGGAIANGVNPLQVTQSTFFLNSASGNGGGIHTQTGTLTLRQSTLSRNSAISQGTFLTGNGGGVFSDSATLVIQNSIFDQNLSTSPATSSEIRPSPDAGADFFINNSLVSDNRGTGLAVTGPTTPDANGNLVGDVTGNVSAQLGALQNNGGPTFTMAPVATSPAINRGSNSFAAGFPNDQRGAPFVRNFGGTVDMGAVEVQPLALVVDTNVDEDDGDYSAGDLSLREAIRLTSANPGADTITFATSTNGTDIDLTMGEMTITGHLTITGNGAANTVIDGQLMSGIFKVASTAGDLSVSGLSIVNGSSTSASAISSLSSGTLTVTDSAFSGNVGGAITHLGPATISRSTFSGNTGGTALGIRGTLNVTESTFSGNTSPSFGGAIGVSGSTATITQSTFSGNSALFGGAIYSFSQPVVVIQSTVAGNHADTGGGIYSESAPVTIQNSIVAGNSDGGTAPDVRPSADSGGDPFVVEFSLIGKNTGTGLTATGPTTPDGNGNLIGDATGIDPLLAPSANNGGPTQTRALLAGSPAFNAGSNTIATPFTFDQRGTTFDRLVAGTVDMGAFESPPQTDIQMAKTAPLIVISGQDLSYTITITNAGPGDAMTVVAADALPAGTTFVSLTQDSGPTFDLITPSVGSGGNVVLDINTLASGASATFTLVVNVGTTVSGHIDNTAQVATTTLDTDSSNNSSTVTTVALIPDDLQIHKDAPAKVDPGANLTYTFTVANTGLADAQTVVVTDAIPANTTFVSLTQTSGPSFTIATPAVGGTGNVVLDTAKLAKDEVATFTLVVKVDSGLTGGTISNTVVVGSATLDSDLTNNTSTVTTDIAQADVQVSKNGPAKVNAGEDLAYTITFFNAGPDPATDVVISDPIPTGATFVSLTQNAGGAGFTTSTPGVGNSGTVTISNPSFGVGQVATYTLVVRVLSGSTGSMVNTAGGTSLTPDPDTSNNTSTVSTTVNAAPTIAGTVADQAITDQQTVGPFSGVTLGDVDTPAQTLTVTVTLDDAAKGVFTAASLAASGFIDQTGGVYRFSGTAAAATTAIRQLVFDPTENRVAPTGMETTTFTIILNDGMAADVTDGTTTVVVTSINDAPTLTVVAAVVAVDEGTQAANGGTFGDVDVGASVVLTASVGAIAQNNGAGTWSWTFTPTDETAAQTVTITATDNLGESTSVQFALDVRNVLSFLTIGVTAALSTDNGGAGQVDAGDALTYGIVVTNTGPDVARNVTVNPLLDPNAQRIVGTAKLFPDAGQGAFQSLDAVFDRNGTYRNGTWYFDSNGSGLYDGGDASAVFGGETVDKPVVGDWNGDGIDDVGVFRNGIWYLDSNGSGVYDAGDATARFGQAGDVPVVGDWNGDGIDDLGVRRNGDWYLDTTPDRVYGPGDLTAAFFGYASDLPVVGDWDGDGRDDIGVFRGGNWYFDDNHSFAYDAGDESARFGQGSNPLAGTSGDLPAPGDWNGDGKDEVGVWRQGTWYHDFNGSGQYDAGDTSSVFGSASDMPVVGKWLGGTRSLGTIQLGDLQPGQSVRVEFQARVATGTPGGTTLTTQAFVNGTDGGTGLPYGTGTGEHMQVVGQAAFSPAGPAVLQTATQVLGQVSGVEMARILFRNGGGTTSTPAVATLQVPAGVTLDLGGSTLGWTQTGPTTYRLAVGPLAPGQVAFADARLTFDSINPPALPLDLVVAIA